MDTRALGILLGAGAIYMLFRSRASAAEFSPGIATQLLPIPNIPIPAPMPVPLPVILPTPLPASTPLVVTPVTATNLSSNGQVLVKSREGLRLIPYADSAGNATVGYGHKITAGDGLSKTASITQATADALFSKDVQAAINAVRSYVIVPLSQNQFDALVSLVYNIGTSAFVDSTLLRLLNAKNYAQAAKQFIEWVHAGGKVVQGLVNRRNNEMTQFLA